MFNNTLPLSFAATTISTEFLSEKTTGFANIECGQIGVIKMQSISGEIIGPPADSEYAVEPVAVDKIKPSAQ